MSKRWKSASFNFILLQKFFTEIRPISRKSIIRTSFFFLKRPNKNGFEIFEKKFENCFECWLKILMAHACVTSDQRAESRDITDFGNKHISSGKKKSFGMYFLLRKDLFAPKLRVRKYFIQVKKVLCNSMLFRNMRHSKIEILYLLKFCLQFLNDVPW